MKKKQELLEFLAEGDASTSEILSQFPHWYETHDKRKRISFVESLLTRMLRRKEITEYRDESKGWLYKLPNSDLVVRLAGTQQLLERLKYGTLHLFDVMREFPLWYDGNFAQRECEYTQFLETLVRDKRICKNGDVYSLP